MSLSRIQSLRLAAVVEDCSDQLDILGHTLRVPAGREQGTAAVQERARLTKLRRDCQYTQQTVFKLHLELEQGQSFTCLPLQEETRRGGREEEQRKKETMQREAERELEHRKQHLQRQQAELQEKTKKLKVLEDMYCQQSLEVDYTNIMEKYTELQLQQTQKEMDRAEEDLEEQLRQEDPDPGLAPAPPDPHLLQKQSDEEARVHMESEKFLQNQHKHLQEELLQLQQRTKLKLQEKEEQLNSVRRRRTVNMDKLSEMRRKFTEMEQVLMEDREEKEKLHQKQAEARAATMLQAWWRGCMVRKGLGGFGKAEKTKKSKKSKDGKKKKKK